MNEERVWEAVAALVAPEFHSFLEEHRDLARRMEAVRHRPSEAVYRQALDALEKEIDRHFVYEEQFILPRLEKYFSSPVAGPAVRLREEHALIVRRFREARETADNRAAEGDVWARQMSLLAYLLLKHIEKEDHYFFPMISRIFTPEERAGVARDVAQAEAKRCVR